MRRLFLPALFFAVSCTPLSAQTVQTIALSSQDKNFSWPQFLVINDDLAFVVGSDTKNIAVVDLDASTVVRLIPLREDMEPYRIDISPQGRVAVSGSKYVALFDTARLLADPQAPVDVSIVCVIDCSRPKPTASTAAIAFPPGAELPIMSALDRARGTGAIYKVLPDQAENLLNSLSGNNDEAYKLFGFDVPGEFYTGIRAYSLPADVLSLTEGAPAQEIVIPADKDNAAPAIRLVEIAMVGDAEGMAVLPDGQHALIVDQDDSMVRSVDLSSGKVVAERHVGIPHLQYPFPQVPFSGDTMDLVLSADGGTAFASNIRSNSIVKLDAQNLSISDIYHLPGKEGGPYGISLSPNGRYVLAAGWGSDTLFVTDIATGAVSVSAVGRRPVDVAVDSKGRAVVTNSEDATLSVVTFTGIDLLR